MTSAPLHPDVAHLEHLLGRWVGEGKGEYPTIESFAYGEEIHVWHVGKPFLAYAQRTWHADDERPLHAETGYFRSGGPGRLELVLAHPTGIVEVQEGTLAGRHIELTSTAIGRTATSKLVEQVTRTIDVDDDTWRYTLSMASVGLPLTHHLAATLARASSS